MSRAYSSRNFINHSKAFTLIELLVVIAIIAILAAILFPVFAQAKAAAKTTASISNMKQQMLGLQIYINDFDDTAFLPWEMGIYPAQLMYPYTKNENITWDASSPIPNFADPMIPDANGYWGDWTLLGTLSWDQQGLEYGGSGPNLPRIFAAQQNPAEHMVALSFSNPVNDFGNAPPGIGGDLGWFTFDGWNQACYADYAGTTWENRSAAGVTRAANVWHTKGYVSGFMDGHAKSLKGMTFDNDKSGGSCGTQTFQFYQQLTSGGTGPSDAKMIPVNPWSTWFLQPNIIKYWGIWFDPDK